MPAEANVVRLWPIVAVLSVLVSPKNAHPGGHGEMDWANRTAERQWRLDRFPYPDCAGATSKELIFPTRPRVEPRAMLAAMHMTGITLPVVMLALALTSGAAERDYRFDGKISREVLENYLSRAVTFTDFLHGKGSVADNLRFLTNTGAKFVGRAIYRWGGEDGLPALIETAKPIARQAHEADSDMILQAACFEIVTTSVGELPVPEWLFREFGLPVEQRTYRYDAMLYPDGRRRNQWGQGGSVPDTSQLETRMWFLFLAASYIDVGVEAIHFGQVEIMDERDKAHVHWRDLLTRVRAYAVQHARRHFVLCDAHVPSGGIVCDGRLLLDFHSFPLRIAEVPDKPQEGVLK